MATPFAAVNIGISCGSLAAATLPEIRAVLMRSRIHTSASTPMQSTGLERRRLSILAGQCTEVPRIAALFIIDKL